MPTCTAPTLPPCPTDHAPALWHACGSLPSCEATPDGCLAPALAICEGTDWPPMTSWELYAAERREGTRVPPSVSTWRPQDVARQREADRFARAQVPAQEPRVLHWGPGPGCEGSR